MKRIEFLRDVALKHDHSLTEFHYRFYKKYKELEGSPKQERYRESFFTTYSTLTPNITDGELIVGELMNSLTPEEQREWDEIYSVVARDTWDEMGDGQDSHMAIDNELLIREGINGVIAKIDGYLKSCAPDKTEYYLTCRRCLEAVIAHSENYSKYALELAKKEKSPERQAELLRISEICKKVPANPAESFYEALQAVHFITYCISFSPYRNCHHLFQQGHPDRYLIDLYRRDVERGELTREYAQLLLDCLGIQLNMMVPHGLAIGYMVGGRDKNGNIVANELTEMCMQVIDDIRLIYPSVGLCYNSDMPEKYLHKACEILSHGRSHPAIFNDDIITKGLMSYGVPEAEARDYIHSACVEITPSASSNAWVTSPYVNMAQLLLDTLDGEYSCYEELISAYKRLISDTIRLNAEWKTRSRQHRAEVSMTPLVSCFVNDCLQKGLDIEWGGGRYNWVMPSFIGMANVTDSLYAIKTAVYDKGEITLFELKNALDNNFEGNELLRLHLLEDIPKYGNDIDEVDAIFVDIINHVIAECKKHKCLHEHADIIPSCFCWIKHEILGRQTGATPDGRVAGFPLGDGSGPCQGREKKGPTASVLSSTKWEHYELIGGVAVNIKFSRSSLGTDSLATMAAIIKTFIDRGGFEIQINIVDKDTLLLAQQSPEAYRDLVVRIGGYSDYFTRLSPEMQSEVILRTEHRI